MVYAFDDFHPLLKQLSEDANFEDKTARYLGALVAELAYHHIAQSEIDTLSWRAKLLMPCKNYRNLVSKKISRDVTIFLREIGRDRPSFAVADRGVVAIGIGDSKRLFIGFRGTKYLYDWLINFNANKTSIRKCYGEYNIRSGNHMYAYYETVGEAHRGFLEEANRITDRITDALKKENISGVEHIFLSGHSLGGAIAALVHKKFSVSPTYSCLFGAPRYCDATSFYSDTAWRPIQVQRPGDMVPCLPSKSFGYSDTPLQLGTNGDQSVEPVKTSQIGYFLSQFTKFLVTRFEAHNMEDYRKELGGAIAATHAQCALMDEKML